MIGKSRVNYIENTGQLLWHTPVIPMIQVAEAGGLQYRDQPQQFSMAPSTLARLSQNKKDQGSGLVVKCLEMKLLVPNNIPTPQKKKENTPMAKK